MYVFCKGKCSGLRLYIHHLWFLAWRPDPFLSPQVRQTHLSVGEGKNYSAISTRPAFNGTVIGSTNK